MKKLKEDRKRHFVIGGNVYKQEIMFCFNMTNQEAFSTLKKTYQGATAEDEENVVGDKEHQTISVEATMYILSKGYLVLLKWHKTSFRNNLTNAMHEILHVVNSVMKKVGIPLNDDTEHAYVYLAEHYFKEFLFKLY